MTPGRMPKCTDYSERHGNCYTSDDGAGYWSVSMSCQSSSRRYFQKSTTTISGNVTDLHSLECWGCRGLASEGGIQG